MMKTALKPKNTINTIQNLVQQATRFISPVWPIETFIACNPLQGLESMPFEEAIQEGARLYGSPDEREGLNQVNREMIKWCGAFLDLGQGTIHMPHRNEGLYNGFRALCVHDKQLHQGVASHMKWLSLLPETAENTIQRCLEKLQVPQHQWENFLKESFAYLPGWAGYVKWRAEWRNTSALEDATPVTLTDFIAIRLVITCILWPEAFQEKKTSSHSIEQVDQWLKTIEHHEHQFRQPLLKALLSQEKKLKTLPQKTPDVQMVFCIDVRSEPFRHCIEQLGNYETFGFAGFFGLPVRIHDYNTGHTSDSCPVLLKPQYDISEEPTQHAKSCVKQHQHGKKNIKMLRQAYQDLKYNFSTPFSLVETLGAWCGTLMLAKSLMPDLTLKALHWLNEKIAPTLETQPRVTLNESEAQGGIPLSDQVTYCETVLKMMGLTKNFGKIVVLCGHGSTTQNNPYASALDCGACGGNHGGSNAKILASMLNSEHVQSELVTRGIVIPQDTQFKAAEHNTTTDEVVLYETDAACTHINIMADFKKNLILAKSMNSTDRCKTFGLADVANPTQITRTRSHDWSEVRPEWGLARNAAFIIGPRRLTQEIALEGRCFLHSYEWVQDSSDASLETILTAPMVVAEWINTQYLFSTLDNVVYGSGSKVTHNVTSKLGLMQGNGSDLMHGLPLQSVMMSDDVRYHEPQRLLTVVYAPRTKIKRIVDRQDILQTLFYHGWVSLIAIDPEDGQAYQLDRQGQWKDYHAAH